MKVYIVNKGNKILIDQKPDAFTASELMSIKHMVREYFGFEPVIQKQGNDYMIIKRDRLNELQELFLARR